jgi:hypothetical protein
VWFDNMKDYTNPALAAYFYLWSLEPIPRDLALTNLCTKTATSGGFGRRFAVTQVPPIVCP